MVGCSAESRSSTSCRVKMSPPTPLRWKLFDAQKKTNELLEAYCKTDDTLKFVPVSFSASRPPTGTVSSTLKMIMSGNFMLP